MGIDIAIALLAVFLAIRGWRRGLTGEIVETIGVIVAVLLTVRVYPKLEGLLNLESAWGRLVAAALVFLGLMLLFTMVGKGLHKLFEKLSLGPVEKMLGLLFGLFKAGVIVAVLCAVILRAGSDGKAIIDKSMLASIDLKLFSWVANFLPGDWQSKVNDALSR